MLKNVENQNWLLIKNKYKLKEFQFFYSNHRNISCTQQINNGPTQHPVV